MSNFYCEKCGVAVTEGPDGKYAVRCEHYPPDRRYDEAELSAAIEKGTKAWAVDPSARAPRVTKLVLEEGDRCVELVIPAAEIKAVLFGRPFDLVANINTLAARLNAGEGHG